MAKITIQNFRKALKGSRGVYSTIAKRLDVNRSAITLYIQRNEKIIKEINEEKNQLTDLAKNRFIEAIENREKWAIEMELKSRDPEYVERKELDLNLTPVTVSFNDPENPYPRIKESKPDMDK
jgi:predicted transcriptional regulator